MPKIITKFLDKDEIIHTFLYHTHKLSAFYITNYIIIIVLWHENLIKVYYKQYYDELHYHVHCFIVLSSSTLVKKSRLVHFQLYKQTFLWHIMLQNSPIQLNKNNGEI